MPLCVSSDLGSHAIRTGAPRLVNFAHCTRRRRQWAASFAVSSATGENSENLASEAYLSLYWHSFTATSLTASTRKVHYVAKAVTARVQGTCRQEGYPLLLGCSALARMGPWSVSLCAGLSGIGNLVVVQQTAAGLQDGLLSLYSLFLTPPSVLVDPGGRQPTSKRYSASAVAVVDL